MSSKRLVLSLIVCGLLLVGSALALPAGKGYKPQSFDGFRVCVNGQKVGGSDVVPIVLEGQTLVPLRALCEPLGAEIVWDAEQKAATITKGERSLTLTMGAYTAQRDGEQIALTVPAQLWGNVAQAPVRLVAEGMGARVQWQGSDKAILVLTGPDYEGYLETPDSFFAEAEAERGVRPGTHLYLDAVAVERFSLEMGYRQSPADSWLFRTEQGDFVISNVGSSYDPRPNWDKIRAGERYRVCFAYYTSKSKTPELPWGYFCGLGELPAPRAPV